MMAKIWPYFYETLSRLGGGAWPCCPPGTALGVNGLLSHSSTHLLHCLRWCSTTFLLVLVTFASCAVVILVQKSERLATPTSSSSRLRKSRYLVCNVSSVLPNWIKLCEHSNYIISHQSPADIYSAV